MAMDPETEQTLQDDLRFLRFYFLESKGERDEFGRLVRYRTRRQNIWISEKETPTRLIVISNEADIRAVYHFDVADRPSTFINAAGERTQAVYNAEGQMVEVRFPNGNVSRYGYDAAGQRIYFEEPGQKGIFARSYDSAGKLRTETTGQYGTIETIYSDDNKLQKITNALGGTTSFTYNLNRELISTTNPQGATEELVRDETGRVVQMKNFDGGIITARYAPNEDRLAQTYVDGSTQEWDYDEHRRERRMSVDGHLLYRVDYENREGSSFFAHTEEFMTPVQPAWRESYGMRSNGVIISRTTNGVTCTWEREEFDRPTRFTGPDGISVMHRYSERGDLIDIADSTGYVMHHQRDLQGNLLRRESPRLTQNITWDNGFVSIIEETRSIGYGSVTSQLSFMRDEQGLMTDIMRDGAITSYTFDDARQLTGVHHTDAEGNTLRARWSYDSGGRLTESISSDEVRKTYTYAPDCRLLHVQGSDGSAVQFFYDKLGRCIRTETTGGRDDGAFTEFSWDSRGYLWKISLGGKNQETQDYYFWSNRRDEICWVDGVPLTWQHEANQDISLVAIGGHTLTVSEREDANFGRVENPFDLWTMPAIENYYLPDDFMLAKGSRLRLGGYEIHPSTVTDLRHFQNVLPRLGLEPVGYATDYNPYAHLRNNPLEVLAPWNI